MCLAPVIRPEGPRKLSPGFTLGSLVSRHALKGHRSKSGITRRTPNLEMTLRDSGAPSGHEAIEHRTQGKPWAKFSWAFGPSDSAKFWWPFGTSDGAKLSWAFGLADNAKLSWAFGLADNGKLSWAF